MNYYLAIDIGASSGRHILGHMENGRIITEEVHRFDNIQVNQNGHDCWDIDHLWTGILDGLKACKAVDKIPTTLGIDTWAVDYVLLDEHDLVVGDAVAYRDSRTQGIDAVLESKISQKELYERTGIQKQIFNTVYQLLAQQKERPDQLEQAKTFLMIPEYFNFLLTGIKQNEYTNATSTNLVNAETKTWDMELIAHLGLPSRIFGEVALPGTTIGRLLPEIQAQVGFDCQVVLPATHDTGSAFLAVPAKDDHAVYLSSGTWSLLGVENDAPITTEESYKQNFTNEGGAWYRYRYLKNIMGLWMIQSIRRELNGVSYVQRRGNRTESDKTWSFPDLIVEAKKAADFPSVVDVNSDCFLDPASMIGEVKAECKRAGQPVPETVGELMQTVYSSLALCYKEAIAGLLLLTGKRYTSINIVGGGCQDMYLNQLTATATGLPVYAGPVEGTAIGNLLVQFIAAGVFEDLQSARNAVEKSFEIQKISP